MLSSKLFHFTFSPVPCIYLAPLSPTLHLAAGAGQADTGRGRGGAGMGPAPRPSANTLLFLG